ncbi:hypothetical protein MAIT1_04814 [Magnetofaba australis IT-1]|uniref:Uncharacterized protein n=2 Tax=Magnetofaba TaxID=1472292 RepID=A0A1Y2K8N1_9PROT|nr:hypothetical protein MAIT1_04814 [Magnetofaba australis IT-1]
MQAQHDNQGDKALSYIASHIMFDDPRHGKTRRHKERVRAVAEVLWRQDPNMTISAMADDAHILEVACEGKIYSKETIRDWVKDLNPTGGKGGRPKKAT